jgi:DtxR family Mn-dependent transcriptional regulator
MDVLTPSLEDYLEAIWTISVREKVARVKDIARHLGVSTPSVVSALNVLAGKNLIKHEKYGYVELTDQGASKAKIVDEHHKLLFALLHEILGVETEIAYKDACRIEHHLSKETIERIKQFIHFIEEHRDEKAKITSRFRHSIEEEKKMEGTKRNTEMVTLGDLKPGEKGHVAKIKGTGGMKKRLMDMGVIPGTEVQLKKIAPLGDPVDILIKGYHLSLRKDEANGILITRGIGS